MIWEHWPYTGSINSLSANSTIAQYSLRARVGGIYKNSSSGICVMPINFRLPKRVITSPVRFLAKITIVHHTTNSVHIPTGSPATGTALPLAVRFVGGTFGYSV
jgi:hypothetical protein